MVKRGEKHEHTYRFRNTGTEPVQIAIITSCDCTTLEWPEGRVFQPGDRGVIHAIFDSTEKEASETVDIDIILEQRDEKDRAILFTVQYVFVLVER
jgi:hypothetical protein